MKDLDKYIKQLQLFGVKIYKYRTLIFIVVVVIIYAGLGYKITNLNSMQPSQDKIDSFSDPIKTAHVDKNTVQQLQSLQDNSVSVQALFDQARNNPFSE